MTARLRILVTLAPHAAALLLALAVGLPARAGGQGQVRDTTVKDLPLTAAQRQAFVGRYSVTLPFGELRSVRIFEENGVLKAQDDDEDKGPGRLLYQGDNVFRPEGIPGFTITFVLESGRAAKFTGRRPDGVMEGVRVP